MKLAFSSNAFRKYSLVETIEILNGIGYQGIEIMADIPHAYPPAMSLADIEAVVTELHKNSMAVSNVNAFMMHAIGDTWRPSWIESDPGKRRQRIEHTLNCINLAADLGSLTLSTEPGGPLDGMGRGQADTLFREGLQAITERARQKNVKILIEPEPDLLLESSQQFLEFMPGLPPEIFGLNFDIGHFYCAGEDPSALVPILSPYTGHFHLEDIAASREHHHLLPGDGAIDLTAVLKAIDQSGYQGFVTVELYPYEDHPIQAAEQAYEYLTRLFSFC